MKTAILYAAKTALTPQHKCLQIGREGVIFIRSEVADADLQTALDLARPLDGETVLNTVEFTATKG